MNKLERDGKIAILVTFGHGSGWSTWNNEKHKETMCMDCEIVQAVLDNDLQKAIEIVNKKCGNINTAGIKSLRVEWVEKGKTFLIYDNEGWENIVLIEPCNYMVA